MINHIRTLLVNLTADPQPIDVLSHPEPESVVELGDEVDLTCYMQGVSELCWQYSDDGGATWLPVEDSCTALASPDVITAGLFRKELGDQIIPISYKIRQLGTALQNARRILFGADPDRAMLNYRTWQLLQTIDAAGLNDYVVALDPRLTYDIRSVQYYSAEEFLPKVTTYGATSPELIVTGALAPCDVTGKMRRTFRITMASNVCTILDRVFSNTTVVNPSFTSGLSAPIGLNNSGLTVQVRSGTDIGYELVAYARPTASISTLVSNLQQLGSPTIEAIFAPGVTKLETELYSLWQDHPDTATKLSAFALALAYKTDEARA